MPIRYTDKVISRFSQEAANHFSVIRDLVHQTKIEESHVYACETIEATAKLLAALSLATDSEVLVYADDGTLDNAISALVKLTLQTHESGRCHNYVNSTCTGVGAFFMRVKGSV